MSLLDTIFGRKREHPAPSVPAPKKPNRFREDAELFAERCRLWKSVPVENAAAAPRMGVLVSPWISTAVPFFAMECALALRHAGQSVTILWDGVETVGNIPDRKHVDTIAALFRELPPDIPIVDVSAIEGRPSPADQEAARRIAYENAVRNVRGEMNVADFFAKHPDAEAATRAHFARVREALAAAGCGHLLIPGGIFGVSAIYVAIAREMGIPFSTFDSGPVRLRLVHDGIAAHLADIPRAFEILECGLDQLQKTRARELAGEELERRLAGSDDRGFQVAAATRAPERCDVLLPLNIRWDSAALSRQRLFASVEENIAAVLEWAESRPSITVCIRQHPNERRDHLRGSDDWESLVASFGQLGSRLRWIAATAPINTYDLIRAAKVVLPHTSTVGVEAALLGTPVVLSTRVYYDAFSFVHSPETRVEFFALLDDAIAGRLPVSPASQAEAALAYFLTQQCAVMRTRLTPQNDDYREWVKTDPGILWREPEPADFLAALRTGEPLTAIRARRILGG